MKYTFEEGMKRLEEINRTLNEGDTALEEMVKLYKEGITISRELSKTLDMTEKEIRRVEGSEEA